MKAILEKEEIEECPEILKPLIKIAREYKTPGEFLRQFLEDFSNQKEHFPENVQRAIAEAGFVKENIFDYEEFWQFAVLPHTEEERKEFEERVEKQYQKMLRFRKTLNLKTNPMKTLRGWAELTIKYNHCPCKSDRPLPVPNKECIDEIKKKGKCYCGKFYMHKRWEEIWGWTKNSPNFILEEWNRE